MPRVSSGSGATRRRTGASLVPQGLTELACGVLGAVALKEQWVDGRDGFTVDAQIDRRLVALSACFVFTHSAASRPARVPERR